MWAWAKICVQIFIPALLIKVCFLFNVASWSKVKEKLLITNLTQMLPTVEKQLSE